MANTFVTSSLIAKDSVLKFMNNATAFMTANTQFENMWENGTYDVGSSVDLRLDNQFQVQTGDTASATDIRERVVGLPIKNIYSVVVNYTTQDLLKNMYVDWSKRVLEPAIQNLVAKVNLDVLQDACTSLNYFTGSTGSSLSDFDDIQEPGTRMLELGVPETDNWYFALTPKDSGEVNKTLKNYFNEYLNTNIRKRSRIGHLSFFDLYLDQSIGKQTTAALPGTLTINANAADGDQTLTIDGFTNNTNDVAAGTVFEIVGRYAVNRITKQATSRNMQFVVTTTFAAAGYTGAGPYQAVLAVSPQIYGPLIPELQNIDVLPLIGDSVTLVNNATYNCNIAYSDQALHMVTPPLPPLDVKESAVFRDKRTGCAIRVSKDADILTNKNILRIDMLVGWLWRPEMAFRAHSQL
jgi:hypothetical protein